MRRRPTLAATLSIVMSTEALAAGSPAIAAGAKAGPKDEDSPNLSRWTKRWSDNFTGWHQKEVHRVLLEHGEHIGLPSPNPELADASCPAGEKGCDSADAAAKSGGSNDPRRIFVPLCGKTVDMAYLAELDGVEVVGVEGVAKALDEFAQENPGLGMQPPRSPDGSAFERREGKSITLLKGDYFDLSPAAAGGRFDVLWDRASLVAIPPDLREKYVSIAGSLVKPGGTVLLLAFDRREGTPEALSGGPPHSVNEEEVRRLFEGAMWVKSVTKVAEFDEMENESERTRWASKGLVEAYELLFIIKAKE